MTGVHERARFDEVRARRNRFEPGRLAPKSDQTVQQSFMFHYRVFGRYGRRAQTGT